MNLTLVAFSFNLNGATKKPFLTSSKVNDDETISFIPSYWVTVIKHLNNVGQIIAFGDIFCMKAIKAPFFSLDL